MRPPSYYASIVKSNHTSSSYRDYGPTAQFADRPGASSMTRTPSRELRSSLSSPSSASYASRSHLPFVSQSTLVAHCYTSGLQPSHRRPYAADGSLAATSRSPTSSSGYSSAASLASLSSRPSSTKRTSPASGSISASAKPYSSYTPPSLSKSSMSYTPSYTASYVRPSITTTSAYLSSSGSSSSRPGYRPLASTTASSSYYRPIRLRERPVLTQISHQLHGHHRPGSTTGCQSEAERPHSSVQLLAPPAPHSEQRPEAGAPESAAATPTVATVAPFQGQDASDWSSDVTRNISRNKYLIKFREIDKPRGSVADAGELDCVTVTLRSPDASPDASPAQAAESETCARERMVPDREPSPPPRSPAPCPRPADEMPYDSTARMTSVTEPSVTEPPSPAPASAAPKKKKLVRKNSAAGAAGSGAPGDEENNAADGAAGAETKKRRNVRLRLKPLVTGNKAATPAAGEPDDQTQAQVQVEVGGAAAKPARVAKRPIKTSNRKPQPSVDEARAELERPAPAATPKKLEKSKRKATAPPCESRRRRSSSELAASVGVATPVQPREADASAQDAPKSAPVLAPAVGQKTPASGGRIRFRQYNYDDFNFLTVLGHGGWGFVILAELKAHDACFAVKCIKKITIVEDDDYDSIMIERKVLALGNLHPFICKLFCTFETEGYLFFVMEYCAGGDLMFHVQREGKFAESRCRFYAAEIICAIKFLHNRHIIYRDLKLDNILLDERGHVRLVDFGMCQCRTYREEMLPSNFCGTPEYISPEIIKGVPYNHSVDWWSYGVLLYEMAVGKMPFRGNDENELLWNVCYEQIHYPMFLSKELTGLLKLLLEREPSKRMGMATCKAGDIHDQPFFRAVDWKAVEELRVPPPFVPEVNSKRDVQNFDTDFTESACELSPVDRDTLDRIDQKQFEKFPYTNPDIFIFDQAAR